MDKCLHCKLYKWKTYHAFEYWMRGAWLAVWLNHAIDSHLVVDDA